VEHEKLLEQRLKDYYENREKVLEQKLASQETKLKSLSDRLESFEKESSIK
jgi:uncharacterized coiled-coil protein SlyX